MRRLDCISQFPQRDTATRCSVLKMEERERRRLGWKKMAVSFFFLLLFALADSFLLREGARTRFYMCEFLIEQKPTLYYGERKKAPHFSCSQQMLCQPRRNTFPFLKLAPHCFPIAASFYYDLHEKYIVQWK